MSRLVVSFVSPHLARPQRLKFGCTRLCTHVERALELFLPTRFPQTIRDRGRTTPDTLNPDNPQVTAAMRYIHTQEILEIPEGGKFPFFPFHSNCRSDRLRRRNCAFARLGKKEMGFIHDLSEMCIWQWKSAATMEKKGKFG